MMMSSIGGAAGMPRLPDLQTMQQMREKMFSKADVDGSGGLQATEFDSLLTNSPMGAAGGVDSAQAFSALDGDGNGSLSQAELDGGMQRMMSQLRERFMSGGGAQSQASSMPSHSQDDALRTLLDAIGRSYGGEQQHSAALSLQA